ncbi:hypothetical protein NM688_g2754 [Phlebia brevispora]|uniref:Uncharacterized protein n=1 Tax=Phlebia brevispora TaxID=194682 RepID=A0ACC1T7W8_9APHY|nr:hypothetical protein NM688_g2754 [Phlebia brevispora]
MSTPSVASQSDIQNLEIQAVTFAAMCGMSGVYFTLFIVTLLTTFRRSERSYKNLRVVTIVLFSVIFTHFICRSIDFNQARRIPQPMDEFYKWVTPLRVVESISTTLAGAISDGLLAYRFWVIFGRKRWALYIPMFAIILVASLGVAQSIANLAIYQHAEDFAYANSIGVDILKISAAWGWSMFAINTTLTLSILCKIIHVTQASKAISFVSGQMPYALIVEAIIESALVTWIGVLFYEIVSLAPQGHYTTNLNIGYVAICILPFFFGISQCLITARLSLIGNGESTTTTPNLTGVVFASGFGTTGMDRSPRDISFGANTEGSDTAATTSDKDIMSKEIFSVHSADAV